MKQSKQDKIDELQNELDCLKGELDGNESEQEELRSIARSLFSEIEKVERQLEDLGVKYD